MAIQCDPITLSTQARCAACLTGERNIEAVKTWLMAQIAANGSTSQSLINSATAAGYAKLPLKQAWMIIVYLLCQGVSTKPSCTPASLVSGSVAYQKLSWRQMQGSIIYLMASTVSLPVNVGAFLATAVSLGWQKVPIKTLLAVQIYLLSNKVFGSSVNVQTLATNAECFQCLGQTQFLAIQALLWCDLAIFFLILCKSIL